MSSGFCWTRHQSKTLRLYNTQPVRVKYSRPLSNCNTNYKSIEGDLVYIRRKALKSATGEGLSLGLRYDSLDGFHQRVRGTWVPSRGAGTNDYPAARMRT